MGPQDLPYFTEDLRKLKRKRQRAYRKGKRSALYIRLKAQFEEKLLKEAMKYKERIFNEVREGKRSSGYKAIRKLGDRPGQTGQKKVVLPAYVELGLTDRQSADRLADHFSAISNTVEPLDIGQFPPTIPPGSGGRQKLRPETNSDSATSLPNA